MKPTILEICNAILEAELLTESELDRVRSELRNADSKDGKAFIEFLVRHQQLSRWQAKFLYQGKAHQISLGSYVLLDKLGQGGMGVVFKARHRTMDRVVAIKTLNPKFFKNKQVVERFQREVKAAARLVHPNIVAAFDAGEARGFHYLVMEYVVGRNLHAIVTQDGPFKQDQAVELILQVARGLEHAHSKGVVHRDVKPNNLMLDADGQVKILDLGLAQLFQTESDPNEPTAAPLTEAGHMMGTVDYIAPEQAQDSSSADLRADIYALGGTLYFLCSGRPMFDGLTPVNRILAHLNSPPPSISEACGASQSLDQVFRRMVAKKPAQRYQSMSEVIEALGQTKAKPVKSQKVAKIVPPMPSDPVEGEVLPLSFAMVNPSRAKPLSAEIAAALLAKTGSSSPKEVIDTKPRAVMRRSEVAITESIQLSAGSDMALPWASNDSEVEELPWHRRLTRTQWFVIGGVMAFCAAIAVIKIREPVPTASTNSATTRVVDAASIEPASSTTDGVGAGSDKPARPKKVPTRPKKIQSERVIGL